MTSVFKPADHWVGERAWGADRVRYDTDTDTVYDPLRRQSARHVAMVATPFGPALRVPLCLCSKDDIDTVVLGTMDDEGLKVHGVVDLGRAGHWLQYLAYDREKKTTYYALPLEVPRPIA